MKKQIRNASVFFKGFRSHFFSGFGDARTLDFDDGIMVLKVFLKYRRSVFDVDLASQKSSKIGKNHIHIGTNRLLNRVEKNIRVFDRFFHEKGSQKAPVLAPEIGHKGIKKGAWIGRASGRASGPLF